MQLLALLAYFHLSFYIESTASETTTFANELLPFSEMNDKILKSTIWHKLQNNKRKFLGVYTFNRVVDNNDNLR